MSASYQLIESLPHQGKDAALELADNLECIVGDGDCRRWNATMIATAVIEGIMAAKENRFIRTNADWHDSMCGVAKLIRDLTMRM